MSGRGRSERVRRGPGPAGVLTVLAGLSVLVHLFGLYRPSSPPSPSWFPDADKAEHLVGFGAPVLLVLLALGLRQGRRAHRLPPRTVALVVGIFAAHAVVSEVVQHFFYVHRTGDPFDVLADWVGVAVGWGLAALLLRRPAPAADLPERAPT